MNKLIGFILGAFLVGGAMTYLFHLAEMTALYAMLIFPALPLTVATVGSFLLVGSALILAWTYATASITANITTTVAGYRGWSATPSPGTRTTQTPMPTPSMVHFTQLPTPKTPLTATGPGGFTPRSQSAPSSSAALAALSPASRPSSSMEQL